MKYLLGLNGYWPASLAQHLTDIGSVSACNRRQQQAIGLPDQLLLNVAQQTRGVEPVMV